MDAVCRYAARIFDYLCADAAYLHHHAAVFAEEKNVIAYSCFAALFIAIKSRASLVFVQAHCKGACFFSFSDYNTNIVCL